MNKPAFSPGLRVAPPLLLLRLRLGKAALRDDVAPLVGRQVGGAPAVSAEQGVHFCTPCLKALTVHRSAMKNRRLRWFSRFGPLTRNGHIPGRCRPLLREGGPISYQPRPEATFPKHVAPLVGRQVSGAPAVAAEQGSY